MHTTPPICCRLYAQIMVSLCLSVLAPMIITQLFPALVGFNVPLRGGYTPLTVEKGRLEAL
jgi:hypothetical protein